mmetsp:Transcript_79929/g.222681  ORF Transcript_79929/g.222681 Transcript_79929/m.222681 type:complete len:289 (-) Transcript_79929:303-1169(-)
MSKKPREVASNKGVVSCSGAGSAGAPGTLARGPPGGSAALRLCADCGRCLLCAAGAEEIVNAPPETTSCPIPPALLALALMLGLAPEASAASPCAVVEFVAELGCVAPGAWAAPMASAAGGTEPTPCSTNSATYGASPASHASNSDRCAARQTRSSASKLSTINLKASARPIAEPSLAMVLSQPFWARSAAPRGHSPRLPARTGEAPCSRRRWTLPTSPFLAAQKSGVRPSLPTMSTTARSSNSNATASPCRRLAAEVSEVLPSVQRRFNKIPLSPSHASATRLTRAV